MKIRFVNRGYDPDNILPGLIDLGLAPVSTDDYHVVEHGWYQAFAGKDYTLDILPWQLIQLQSRYPQMSFSILKEIDALGLDDK